jgi:transposase-like protein/ribosomal protein S27AE
MSAPKGAIDELMIRFFAALRKTELKHLSDEDTFERTAGSFNHYSERCPNCGAKGKLSFHSKYTRYIISINENDIKESNVSLSRYKCQSCGATHALLPANIIPYSSYCLRFKLTVLAAYFERNMTVVAICDRYGVAISTLYAWKRLFMEHKSLFLGALADLGVSPLVFARELISSTQLARDLSGFASRLAFSFMQGNEVKKTQSHPP